MLRLQYGQLGQQRSCTAGSVGTHGATCPVPDAVGDTILSVSAGAGPLQQAGDQDEGGSVSAVAHLEGFPSLSSDQWNKLMSLLGMSSSKTPLDNTRMMGAGSSQPWIIDTEATLHATGPNYKDSDWSG
ncbi:hypothetical protein LIER_14239 [Lithospermum erythrorhizon]|uniref:Uncharacterized protein n=1 Tax=Lithospermum erythrorhizon TaxID=34254 RepID=A0AAV3PZZ2_LITER